jgi:transcriptional regulator with XRE-family HTH domain
MREGKPGIAAAIRRAASASGLSQRELAKAAGVHESGLSRFMSGQAGLRAPVMERLAARLGLRLVGRRGRRRSGRRAGRPAR